MSRRQIVLALFFLAVPFLISRFASASSCPFSGGEHDHHGHDHHHAEPNVLKIKPGNGEHDHDEHFHFHSRESHDHDHDHDHHHGHHDHHGHDDGHHHHHHHPPLHQQSHHRDHEHLHPTSNRYRLAEEIAEEDDLQLHGFESPAYWHEQHQNHVEMSPLGLWLRSMGCSLLVSMASLICLVLLPLFVVQGKPSRIVVDSLAAFGAGAMLGDAFLHQLPHALGSSSGHSHLHGGEDGHAHDDHGHSHSHSWSNSDGQAHISAGGHGHGHAHSIQDLSVGLAVLAGIILFFIVEKIVRQVEKSSSNGVLPWVHHHHHHHHHHRAHLEDGEETETRKQEYIPEKGPDRSEEVHDDQLVEKCKHDPVDGEKLQSQEAVLRKRVKKAGTKENDVQETSPELPVKESPEKKIASPSNKETPAPNLVLGYLNLFSDGVHNFTDGMALGSAFLNHGIIGGWSRTLFLLAHELPQEVGDFGILVQSGFSVLKALAFNFLSALVALAGTALALMLGGSPGHSSLIEGFTAGGFIYIAVAGVLPEMHQYGTSAKTTVLQLIALGLGMSIAMVISLLE